MRTTTQGGFRRIFPQYEKYIKHVSIGTPLTTNNFLATEVGECYGLAATPERFRCPDLSPHTPVPNLFLTGQDVITLGISGAVSSGYMTANVVAGYDCVENILLQRDIMADLGLKPIY